MKRRFKKDIFQHHLEVVSWLMVIKKNRIYDTYLSPQLILNWGHYKLADNFIADNISYSGSISLIFVQHLSKKYKNY